MNYAITQEDWDKVSEPIAHLQKHGVPINDAGVYLQNFAGLEFKQINKKPTWVYYWNEE